MCIGRAPVLLFEDARAQRACRVASAKRTQTRLLFPDFAESFADLLRRKNDGRLARIDLRAIRLPGSVRSVQSDSQFPN